MASPYKNRPARSFWKSGVTGPQGVSPDIYVKRFSIERDTRIATAGSCFAQHIAVRLVRRGYNVLDAEPAPMGLSLKVAQSFGYNLYSARYGNVYTARQMLQLARESFGLFEPADAIWTKSGRFYDALRPNVEPKGLGSADEVLAHRADHLRRVRDVLETANLLIFTLGLTETWIHTASRTVYPTAPETIAGHYSPDVHSFKNFTYNEVLDDLNALRDLLKEHNPGLRMFLTVSPVPLMATASDNHVLPATVYSKAVLRAAAGAFYTAHQDVDYFPSFEIVSTPFVGPLLYDSDLRTVTEAGVNTVMRYFFTAHGDGAAAPAEAKPALAQARSKREADEDVVCEEKLLEAFA